MTKIKSYLQFMEDFIEKQIKQVNLAYLGGEKRNGPNSRLSIIKETKENMNSRAGSALRANTYKTDSSSLAFSDHQKVGFSKPITVTVSNMDNAKRIKLRRNMSSTAKVPA